jgi:hypothetical protein
MAAKVSENVLRLARLLKEDYYSKSTANPDLSPTERANMLSRIRGAQKTMCTNELYAPYLSMRAYAHLVEADVDVDAAPEDPKPTHAARMKTWRANNRIANRTYMREYMREYRSTKREQI